MHESKKIYKVDDEVLLTREWKPCLLWMETYLKPEYIKRKIVAEKNTLKVTLLAELA